jgi:hypothetical protein
MEGMTKRQIRMTNRVANDLISEFHICETCAIALAPMLVRWHVANVENKTFAHQRTPICSQACNDGFIEFMAEYFGPAEEISGAQLEEDLEPRH